MKVGMIIKNARIFTSDVDNPIANALVVNDGRFEYVGDESGLSDYEGEVMDFDGMFIMPGIIDSHVHVTMSAGLEYTDLGTHIECENKKEVLSYMAESIRNNPDLKSHRFAMERKTLGEDDITKEDLDAICPDGEVMIVEDESHSVWVNSALLAKHHITDDTPDPMPGLSYFVRKDGHVTGNVFEYTIMRFFLDDMKSLIDEQIDKALERWVDYSVKAGVTCVFDAGIPEGNDFHERVYARLCEMDRQGRLPVYIDGCYVSMHPKRWKEDLKALKHFNRDYNTEHLKVHTLKIFMDGTIKIETAALITPYEGTNKTGVTSYNKEQLAEVLRELNGLGFDLHLHTVGEGASRTVLDSVETVKKELGDAYRVKVTCAHLEIQDDTDMDRFAELGVFANYTPWWHAGNTGGSAQNAWCEQLGEKRANSMYRCKTLWDTGAYVTWSSDEVYYGDFMVWNPYLGMEVGMTRHITEKTKAYEWDRTDTIFPPNCERMSIDEMILGYTINGARQLGIDAYKGSIKTGKDADFLVFDKDLLMAEHEGFSYNIPKQVYICGERMS